MRVCSTTLVVFIVTSLLSFTFGAQPSTIVAVWPDAPPAWDAPEGTEHDSSNEDSRDVAGKNVIRLTNVTKPEMHVYPAKDSAGNPSQTVLVICPGGGFNVLAWDLEGTEVAEHFQAGGATAVVLKYRVPTAAMDPKWHAPVQDIQRAVALVRAGKVTGHLPTTVGVLGFSAGGHASARAATAKQRLYDAVDESDREISPPDFACLIYPAWLTKESDLDELADGFEIDKSTPRMFFVHGEDDPHDVLNSVTMFRRLHEVGVPAGLHVFTGSGHGFGARLNDRADDAWPQLCLAWMQDEKLLAR